MEKLIKILKTVKYGEIKIIIRDGNITEIQRTEKVRI